MVPGTVGSGAHTQAGWPWALPGDKSCGEGGLNSSLGSWADLGKLVVAGGLGLQGLRCPLGLHFILWTVAVPYSPLCLSEDGKHPSISFPSFSLPGR